MQVYERCHAAGMDDVPPLLLSQGLRELRHRAALSQRELAALAEVPHSTVARLELPGADPRLSTAGRVVCAAGGYLAVLSLTGKQLWPWVFEPMRDRGGRHYPAHFLVRPVIGESDWWGSMRYSTWMRPPIPDFTYEARLRRRRDDAS